MERPRLQQEYEELLRECDVPDGFLEIQRDVLDAIRRLGHVEDERDDFRARRTYGELTDLNTPYRLMSADIVAAMERSTSFPSVEIDTLSGIFPTGSLNAQARQCKSGVLILINRGLLTLLQQFPPILLQYSAVQDQLLKIAPPERCGREITVRSLSEVFTKYVEHGTDPSLTNKYGLVGGHLGGLQTLLTTECVRFVLAHEHAHAALGHLGKTQAMRTALSPVGDLSLIKKSWEEEAAADLGGVHAQVTLSDSQQGMLQRIPIIVAAICIFFSMDRFIDAIYRGIANKSGIDLPIISDHPPSALRYKWICTWFRERIADDAVFEVADCFRRPTEDLFEEVVLNVQERILSALR